MADVRPRTIAVRNPRTGRTDFDLPVATAEEVAAKAARLRENQKAWAALGLQGRSGVMARWLAEVRKRAAAIADADAEDTGGCHTSYLQGFITMGNIGGWLEDAAGALEKASYRGPSRAVPTIEVRTQFVPYPLCGVISPWNAPMMLALLDAVPALFAGCAVLLKPSEVTPRFTVPLFESIRAVPELAAVFDFVTGDAETGKAVIDQADVVCFTGSAPTGRKIAVHCAQRLIPCYLELGGKDPVIVTASADIERAATAVLRGAAHANGMVCFSVERIYVAESIHDAFVAKLIEKAQAVKLNCGNPRAGHVHPFTFAPQAAIVQRHLADAVARGAKIHTGGEVETHGGLYMRPTVLTGVTHDMLIMQDETFGPCLPVMKFRSIDEAVALANDTTFGLTASVIAGTEAEALPIAERLNAGAVFVQDTFLTFAKNRTIGTNSFGYSGVGGGSRTGPEAILRFLRRKALMTQHGEPADIQNDHHLPKETQA